LFHQGLDRDRLQAFRHSQDHARSQAVPWPGRIAGSGLH
jgi:hypothetical protein